MIKIIFLIFHYELCVGRHYLVKTKDVLDPRDQQRQNSTSGADYSRRSSICNGFKKTEVKKVGEDYTMTCGRKVNGKLAKFDKCQIKSPWGETFDVDEDLSGDGGRVVCYCKVDMVYTCAVRVHDLEEKDNGKWSCILHYQKFGRNKTSTVAHNVLITKEAHEKRTLDNQKEECKKKRIPKKKEKEKKTERSPVVEEDVRKCEGPSCPNVADKKTEGSCSPGWTEGGRKCYRYVKDKLTWVEAEAFCKNDSAHLVSVRDQKENDIVFNLIKDSVRAVWLGGKRRSLVDQWQWTDGSEWSWQKWDKGEPNNLQGYGTENCLEMYIDFQDRGGSWNDNQCENKWPYPKHPFICQKNKN